LKKGNLNPKGKERCFGKESSLRRLMDRSSVGAQNPKANNKPYRAIRVRDVAGGHQPSELAFNGGTNGDAVARESKAPRTAATKRSRLVLGAVDP